jgi:hypothetical protein
MLLYRTVESIEAKVVMACELSQLTAYWTAQNLVSALLHDVTPALEHREAGCAGA